MIGYIRNYNLRSLRGKLILLYALNCLDMAFTLFLLGTGSFIEANPFIAQFSGSAAPALKTLLPAALLLWLFVRLKSASGAQLKKANAFIGAALVLYALVNAFHIFWTTAYLTGFFSL